MVDQVNLKTVHANGMDFHYVECGSGEPTVFVHGSLGDYRTWTPQLDGFNQHYRAISYSRRYHYPNLFVGPGTDSSPSQHAADLIALIEALDLGVVNLVGNSFGAYTSLVTTIRRPDLVRKCVVGEPPVLYWLKEIPEGVKYWTDFMQSAWIPARQAFRDENMERGVQLFVDGVFGQGSFAAIPEAPKNRMLSNAASLKAETYTPDYFTEITAQQLKTIQTPILLLKGEKSERMFHLVIDHLAQFLPGARQATIKNASHSIPSGNPQEYNQVVLTFLQAG